MSLYLEEDENHILPEFLKHQIGYLPATAL